MLLEEEEDGRAKTGCPVGNLRREQLDRSKTVDKMSMTKSRGAQEIKLGKGCNENCIYWFLKSRRQKQRKGFLVARVTPALNAHPSVFVLGSLLTPLGSKLDSLWEHICSWLNGTLYQCLSKWTI